MIVCEGLLAGQQVPTAAETIASSEGQPVSAIDIAGRPDITGEALERLKSQVKQQAGHPFDAALVTDSIHELKNTGKFEDVRLDVRPEGDGVRVTFLLEPAYYIGQYRFPGAVNSSFSYSRLLQISNYTVQEPYSALNTEKARSALENHFRREGYFRSAVSTNIQTDPRYLIANVDFNTALDEKAKFGDVTVAGVGPEDAASLRRSLTTYWARLRGVAVRPGKTYSYRRLQSAMQHLQREMARRDHLAAQVKLAEPNYDAESNRADVRFEVTPGPILRVRTEGARVRGRTLRRLVPMYQTNLFNSELVLEGRQNLESHLQSRGYFDAEVHADVKEDANGTTLLYEISRGPRGKVAEVRIVGNQHFSQKELQPHITVKQSRFLSRGRYSEQLLRTSTRNLTNLYRSAGFSDVKVDPEVDKHDGNLNVTFHITEGEQDLVESFEIEGSSLAIAQLAPNGLRIGPGKPFSPFLANQDRNEILARYLSLGYLTATFNSTVDPIERRSHRVHVVYKIAEGQQVKTARIIILGREHTQQYLVDRTVNMAPGSPLSQDQLLSAESRLYSLGVFDWAEIDPKRPIEQQTEEDVLIKLHQARRNVINTTFGFEVINRGGSVPSGTVAVPGLPPVGLPSTFTTSERTFWGPTGSFTYTRRDVRGMGDTFWTNAFGGRLDQRGSSTYAVPSFRSSRWTASTSGSFEHSSENPVYTALIGQAVAEFRRSLDAKNTKTLFFRYTFSRTSITDLLIPDLVPPQDRDVRLSTLSVSYARDTRDFILDAHKGIYQSFELAFNPSWLGSSANFMRFLGQVAYYKNVGAGIIWANSVRLGLEHPFGDSFIPLSEEFFTGGGSTLRGFPLNGAGPQDTIPACSDPANPATCTQIRVPTGGNQLFILNSEFRIPVPIRKGFGIAIFYDGGNVFQTIGIHTLLDNYSNTIGGGLRYATPVGPIRLDIGHNLSPIPGIKATQVFLTLGQAF